ncbi:MAG: AAA family ATPase [Deltaproteobacteria bacterium]|nr:AAA family ATPase [Deltaproteobacteria bacterium]
MIRTFGDFELDEDRCELRCSGALVPVQPKVFNLLAYLIRQRERVVTKEELLEKLWPGECVSDWSLSTCVRAVRSAVADDGAAQQIVKTFHGRGYRFVAAVDELDRPRDRQERSLAPAAQRGPLERRTAEVFVGRRFEMNQLHATLDAALAGHGRLVMLVGEPGIGKTRTAEELATHAEGRGAQVLWGRCYEGDGAPAFWPWVQIMRGYVRRRDPDALRREMGAGAVEIAHMLPLVRERMPEIPVSPPGESEQARFRLFDSIANFLTNAATARPLVLILDDLHWADRPSLLLLQFLARAMESSSLLVLGTYRDIEVTPKHSLADILGTLCREPLYERLALHGLPEEDVQALLSTWGTQEVAGTFARFIARVSEGNPFFIKEFCRHLVEENLVVREGGRWVEHVSAGQLAIPQEIRVLIERRLAHLSAPCRRLLTIAAVIGREFALPVIARVWSKLGGPAEAAEPAALELLDGAVAARILDPSPRHLGRYRFSHALICETLYDDLPPSDRARLHRHVAECLEDFYRADLEPHLSGLAHHFVAAAAGGGDSERAIVYCLRAAERASAALAYEEAVAHYERALQVLALQYPVDETRRCHVLLALGEAWWKAGEPRRAKDSFYRAAERARRLGAAQQLAGAALGVSRWVEMGVVDGSQVALLEEALAKLGKGDGALRAKLLGSLAHALRWSNSHERRATLSRQAVAMARQVRDMATLAWTLNSTHWVRGPEDAENRLAATAELLRLAEQLGDREMALTGHFWRVVELLELGDIAGVDSEMDCYIGLAEELRDPFYLWLVPVHRAMRALLDGRFEDAGKLAAQGLAVGQRLDQQDALFLFEVQMAILRFEEGRLDEIDGALNGFVERYPSIPTWRCARAELYKELGCYEEARREFDALAVNQFADLPRDDVWVAALAMLAEVCAFLGDAPRAAILYNLLLPHASRCVVISYAIASLGSAARFLGVLATTMQRWHEAERHFEEAMAMNARIGARSWLASGQHDYARMLLARHAPGDHERAVALLHQAIATAEQLGMSDLAGKASALRREVELAVAQAGCPSVTAPKAKASRRPQAGAAGR